MAVATSLCACLNCCASSGVYNLDSHVSAFLIETLKFLELLEIVVTSGGA